ncbi:hypothetical protein [Streptomyces xanthophaeus]
MIATVVAIVGAVVTIGSLVISYLAHRHQVRRARVLDQREARLQAQEERLESRARAVDRRNDLTQASMIETNITVVPSGIHEGSATPHLKIANPSNQPILDLRVTYAGHHLTDAPEVSALVTDAPSLYPSPRPPARIPPASSYNWSSTSPTHREPDGEGRAASAFSKRHPASTVSSSGFPVNHP